MNRTRSCRRKFLNYCAGAGLILATPLKQQPFTLADEQKEIPAYDGPYYIVFNASGGWDTTYLMDPKGIEGINRLYTHDDILTQGVHRFAPTEKHKQGGLSNEAFFEEFGRELLGRP